MAINSKSLISFAGAAFAFVGVGSGFAAELIVEDGATVTATESATYESSDIRGKYTVSAGLTVKATANALGSTQSTAELVVDGTGAVFGENSTASYNMTIGTGGGKGKIICRNGGSFRCGLFTLASDSLVDEDGYADVLDVEETATIYGREFYNKNASATARIRIKGGTVPLIRRLTGILPNSSRVRGLWMSPRERSCDSIMRIDRTPLTLRGLSSSSLVRARFNSSATANPLLSTMVWNS